MSKTAYVTIVSNNYLHFARTLMQSVAACHADVDRYCVVVDKDLSFAKELDREFRTISLDQLQLPDGEDFLFQYTVLELNTAVKPWALDYLLSQGYDRVVYIDPDIYLYRPLQEVLALLEGDVDIVLTPHLLRPIDDSYHPTELDIRRAGTYNLGFCAIKNSDNTRNYLRWWQKKLRHDCVVDFERGVFVDQSWMDLVPGMFDRVAVLRHPGYNVAYWNLAQRSVVYEAETDDYRVDGHPLVFFHYSGLNYRKPQNVSKHQNRFNFSNLNQTIVGLFREYVARVRDNDAPGYSQLRYAFDYYDTKERIAAAERSRLRTDPVLRKQCQGKPFAHQELLRLAPSAASEGTQGAPSTDSGVDSVSAHRVCKVYRALLGREPEPGALIHYATILNKAAGSARVVCAIGLSREARLTRGWLMRLLHFLNTLHHVPRPAKRWLLEPLYRTTETVSKRWSRLAWRPPGGHIEKYLAVSDACSTGFRQQAAGVPLRTLEDLPSAPGFNLVGYLAAELGIGEAARSLARACAQVNVSFSAYDVGYQTQNLQRDDSIISLADDESYNIDLLYVNADQTAATAYHLRTSRPHPAGYTIGFWHWEQPAIPLQHCAAFAHVDEVWVPTTFVHDAVSAVSPVPVCKIPHALDLSVSQGISRTAFGLPDDRPLVLVMYDFHSYQYRKNPEAAVAAFRLAAQKHPECGLVLKTINSQHYPQSFAELKDQVADLPHVYFIDDFLTRQQVWDLQSCCDILLSLHRAEGFGLAPAEMMYLGKPVVATGWSGNMDFMTNENSMPVRYELKPLEFDQGAYPAGPLWAEADIDHAAWCLEQLVEDSELGRRLGKRAQNDVRRQLSPAVVGRQIQRRLRMLRHWYPDLIDSVKKI